MQTTGAAAAQRMWAALLKSHAAAPVNMQWLPVLACWLTNAAGQTQSMESTENLSQQAASTAAPARKASPRKEREAKPPKKEAHAVESTPERTQQASPGIA